ncbi:cytochrome c oxidase subunit II [Chitinasiproducens palmae]|uniref:Cytochrome aa3 subunit 2 n=1 Tax=Chitinasiproducens palmae TaxID=1770053 RepID=A0A1H2PJS1_9BURK|nr:cytochrome c oxidase subunit II [Chitinasiproducens palmae]SDV46165.1 cytochrome c oxidase subunit 2 [Chitinasiproducens palmae]
MLAALSWLAASPAVAAAAPLSYVVDAAGPAARPALWLVWGVGAVCVLVCLIVALLLVGALARRRPAREFGQLERSGRGVKWIYFGTALSVIALLGIVVAMLVALRAVSRPAVPTELAVRVTAYDWWWRIDYPASPDAPAFVTANELHIPVGVPVRIDLDSADVIHAFWVPALAGKTQAIPGQTNRQWLQADRPGVFRGQCTQFCGAQHAHMAFEVIAESPAAFQRWRAAQASTAAPVRDRLALRGQALFGQLCAGCHAVRGSGTTGQHAPDLTHLGSRRMLAAATLPNDAAHLRDWLRHTQSIKPGARMPDFDLPEPELSALMSYLATLK